MLERLRLIFSPRKDKDAVEMTFWFRDGTRSNSFERSIRVPTWESIAANYPGRIRTDLDELMSRTSLDGYRGQLLLWHGEPGTGKTWAVRALARSWDKWCSIEYVTDPERFFDEADYMMKVAIEGPNHFGEVKEDWRLLVLEDTGELLSADAKSREGQRLSRLLNVVDGLIGQGLKLMLLITTNEELRSLHPAVSRPGRCAGVLEFPLFTTEEAADWLVAHASDAEPPVRAALADLYALHACAPARARPASVGFATA